MKKKTLKTKASKKTDFVRRNMDKMRRVSCQAKQGMKYFKKKRVLQGMGIFRKESSWSAIIQTT